MAVELFTNDEQPGWVATILMNGTSPDYSTGYTFTCTIVNHAGTTLLTKTTGITGATAGVITVAFTGAELSGATVTATVTAPLQDYRLFLTPRRTSDSADGPTIAEQLVVRYRP